jgi:competence protein ComEC
MVVDVGPDNGGMQRCLGDHLAFWDKTIELMIISHWDTDHSGGLSGVNSYYKVDKLFSIEPPKGSNEQITYSGNLVKNDILRYGEIETEILSPETIGGISNDDSLVLMIGYKGKKVLMMGDVSTEVEQRLIWRQELKDRVDVLKVSHHGSATATSRELLDVVLPKMAIISVGAKNKFGHPSEEVMKRLSRVEAEVKRTDTEGDIELEL